MGLIQQVSLPTAALGLGVSLLTYAVGVVVYRLYFHPLAKIPGPKFAAATFFCEFWYNIPKEGSYIYEIERRLLTRTGPIVRITPDEVHVIDIDDYEKIFHVGSKYYKDINFYHCFGPTDSIFSLESNAAHRVRRQALTPLFTPKVVKDLEWLVQKHVSRLVDRISAINGTLDLHRAFRCVSVDVISDYGFGRCYDLLLTPDFGVDWSNMIEPLAKGIWVFKFMPVIGRTLMSMPLWLAKIVSSEAYGMMQLQENAKTDIIGIQDGTFKTTHQTIFHQLLDPHASEGYVVPSLNVLADEGAVFLAAASETTGHAMEVVAMGIMQNPEIYKKVKDELEETFPDKTETPSLSKLEKLPYLTACLKEGLRLSYGVVGRLPRVVPTSGDTFHGYNLPPGTIISCSSFFIHRQERTFGENFIQFNPSNWLDEDAKKRERALIAFSKGSRMCIGMNLAWSELYLTIGRVFHTFDLKMSGASSVTLEPYRDFFSTFPPAGQPGLLAEKAAVKS